MIINLMEEDFDYDKIIRAEMALAKQYHTIIKYVTIGASHDNRDIVLLKLGLGQKYMVCIGGVHGRETINPVVLLRIIEYYAEYYMNYHEQRYDLMRKLKSPNLYLKEEYVQMLYGACINELLKTFTILIVPLLNPDGYMISLKGYEVIGNPDLKERCLAMGQPYPEWKYNGRGVDINRNFPCRLWRQKHIMDTPASENETKALIKLFHDYRTKGFLDFHSRGKQIYYYRSQMPDSYNKKQLEIASRFQNITDYVLMAPEEEIETGDSGGNTVHYYSETFKKPALTIETVEEEATFPMNWQYRLQTFEELKNLIFEFGSMII
jgi:g-D-glutamyl-meso-diaminopimelate peptidase